jgi:peptide deformylase
MNGEEKRRTYVKDVVLLNPGKWGIVIDFVLEEKELVGKELIVDYDETDDLNETRDGCLMIETQETPFVKRGDTIEITIRDRSRKKRRRAVDGREADPKP